MLEIECATPTTSPCSCCGKATTTVTRFVTIDGEARGVYYAAFAEAHPERSVIVLLSLGPWWDGTSPKDRVAFAFRIWTTDTNFQVGLIDADEAGWQDAGRMGRRLSRKAALKHPLVKEVFHVSDHIVDEDPEVRGYLVASK